MGMGDMIRMIRDLLLEPVTGAMKRMTMAHSQVAMRVVIPETTIIRATVTGTDMAREDKVRIAEE